MRRHSYAARHRTTAPLCTGRWLRSSLRGCLTVLDGCRALISLDLAIVNFLPIPALAGGHVLFLFIEKLYGKPLDEDMVNSIATAGFMFLILLMIIVLYNDIVALVLHKI